MDSVAGYKLVKALSAAGFFLLALELFFPGMAMATIGAMALFGATAIAYYACGIDVGSVLLLIISTVWSLGFLIALVCFPKSPLSRRFLRRAAEKAAVEESEPKG